MSQEPPIPPIDDDEPVPPRHSLPSYNEPTPETHRKMTREEEAELALNNTEFAGGTRSALIALFLLTIAAVPSIQLATELQRHTSLGQLPMVRVFASLPAWSRIHAVKNLRDLWNVLPHPAELKTAERTLENDSVVSQWLLPRTQYVLTKTLHAGNEQVYPGRDHWLFYRADVDHVIGPPFLDPFRLKRRTQTAEVQPDPIRAIVEFRDQLATRGIELVILPIPGKPNLEGVWFSSGAANPSVQNASFPQFILRLKDLGISVFDPTPLLVEWRQVKNNLDPLYLKTDTHWRPETMQVVAEKLSLFLHLPATGSENTPPTILEKETPGRGDIAAMLKLPAGQDLYQPEKVTIRQVFTGNTLWRPTPNADVLLLGDSFSNIFSVEAMGWGESAGFAEHLSLALRRPIDCILRNSDAAFATREILSTELARGHDRLAGKKLVIWEFATRELSFGNWKLLDLKLGQPKKSQALSLNSGQEIEVIGTIESVSPAPRPGTVPYQDHIIALHLIDIEGATLAKQQELHAVVYLWSMRANAWTPAARLRPGDRIRLSLKSWSDVSAQCEKFNRTELDDPALQLEEPVWGELTN